MTTLILSNIKEVSSLRVLGWLTYWDKESLNITELDVSSNKINISFSNVNEPEIILNKRNITHSNKWSRKYFDIKSRSFSSKIQNYISEELKSFQISLIACLKTEGKFLGYPSMGY
jgi:hypothetical protein